MDLSCLQLFLLLTRKCGEIVAICILFLYQLYLNANYTKDERGLDNPILLLILALSAYVLAILYTLSTGNNALVFRDTAQLCGVDSYWGLFSNFGIILWSVTSGVTLFLMW